MSFFRKLGHWLFNDAMALDQVGNAIIGGPPKSTISANCGQVLDAGRKPQCWLCGPLCWVLERPFWPAPFGPDHCKNAYRRGKP